MKLVPGPVHEPLRSFDVFDTVVTRLWALPQDLFTVLGERALKAGWVTLEASAFALQRVDAESAARRGVPGAEVRLDEIYAELGRRHGWAEQALQSLIATELELELACSRPVPAAAARLAQARAAGHRIAFISDTYLPQEFVHKLLLQAGAWQEGDALWVSQAHRCSKAGAGLFAKVREELQVSADWFHWGDNPHSDVSVPRSIGISAEAFDDGRLNRFETMVRGQGGVRGGLSKLAGVMRLARLQNAPSEARQKTIWDVSVDIVGPLLFGFVLWCMQSAQQRGLKRLYFVARDGQILHRIAERIAKHWSFDIDCRYLCGSRQAWHPAGMSRLVKEELAWIMPPTKFLSVQQAFERVGVDPAIHIDVLAAHGFFLDQIAGNLDSAARQRLEKCLLEESITLAAESRSAVKRELLRAYLQQERVLDDANFAIVDIGWSGNLQNSLARVLNAVGHGTTELTGFYFGLLGQGYSTQSVAGLPGQTKLGYWNAFAAPEDPLWRQNLALFECFTAADHGSVIGFEASAGRISPLLASSENRRALDWGLATLQEGVLSFVELWIAHVPRDTVPVGELFRVTRAVLDEFYEHPTATEAQVWGGFCYSDGQTEAAFEQFVPVWRSKQTLAALFDPQKRPTYWWPQGTQALYPSLPLLAYLALKRLKRSRGLKSLKSSAVSG